MDPPPSRLLVQMSGAPGSGKSTLARKIAQSTNGSVISHDLIKSFFLENDFLFERSAQLTYSLQWVLAKDLIEQGQNTVVIDSTCNFKETLDRGEALALQYNYKYIYVECRLNSLELLDARLRSRVTLRSQRTSVKQDPVDAVHSEDYQALFNRWINDPCRPTSNAIVVDSTSSPEECLDFTLGQIARLELSSTTHHDDDREPEK